MGKLAVCILLVLSIGAVFSIAAEVLPETRSKSEVRIAVGEAPNFLYKIYGVTYSQYRISVSGDYFNDEFNHFGYAHLFLGAQPDISDFYYEPGPGNQIHIEAVNSYGRYFYYDVLVPSSVPAETLAPEFYNHTALIIRAPSRSAYIAYP